MLRVLLKLAAVRSRAGVSIVAAAAIVVLIAMADLCTEYGFTMVEKVRDQRIADSAAYSGALAYSAASTNAAMTSAVSAMAQLNGLPGADAGGSLTASPRNDGNNAVKATVTTPYTLAMTGITLNPSGTAYAELTATANPCIIALNAAGTGISLSGGTKLTASGCSVSSDQSVSVTGGATLETDVLTWESAAPTVTGGASIVPATKASTSIKQVLVADPFKTNTSISAATARLATVASEGAPAGPSAVSGTNLTFGYTASPPSSGNGCTITQTSAYSGNFTITCPAGGTYNFGSMTVPGSVTVAFDTGGTSSTYNFGGEVLNQGNALTFGSGTFNFAGGLETSSTTSFGGGTFTIGALPGGCGDGATYSICNTSTLTFSGAVTMTLTKGLYNGGGEKVTMGAGSAANSYVFGASSGGNAISVYGGSTTVLGSAAGGGLFQMAGNILAASGGECLTLPATSQHDIKGYISTGGGLILGAGVYTVTGNVDIGGSNGGNVTCNGSSVGVSASGVTLVIGATTTDSGCSGQTLCISNGFSNVVITAPASGNTENLAVIGPTGGSTDGATLGGSGSAKVSGVFYLPNGPLSLDGAATLSGGSGCLELVASQITLSGGAASGTVCPGFAAAATSYAAKLVE
jgi:hypothetical protein